MNPLIEAIKSRDKEKISNLLDHGGDVYLSIPDTDGNGPLFYALGDVKILQMILSHPKAMESINDCPLLEKDVQNLSNQKTVDQIAEILYHHGVFLHQDYIYNGIPINKIFHSELNRGPSQLKVPPPVYDDNYARILWTCLEKYIPPNLLQKFKELNDYDYKIYSILYFKEMGVDPWTYSDGLNKLVTMILNIENSGIQIDKLRKRFRPHGFLEMIKLIPYPSGLVKGKYWLNSCYMIHGLFKNNQFVAGELSIMRGSDLSSILWGNFSETPTHGEPLPKKFMGVQITIKNGHKLMSYGKHEKDESAYVLHDDDGVFIDYQYSINKITVSKGTFDHLGLKSGFEEHYDYNWKLKWRYDGTFTSEMILNGTKTTGNKIEYFKDGVLTVATPSPLPPPRTIIVEQNASFDFHVDKLPSELSDQWLSRIRNKLQKLFSKRDSSFSYRFFLWIETSEPPTIEKATSSTVTVEIQIGLSNIMVTVRGTKEYIDANKFFLRTMMEQDIPQLIIENLPLLDKVPPKKTTAIKVASKVATTNVFNQVSFQEEKRRKALQQINKKRRNTLLIGQQKTKYKTALLANYRGTVGKTPISDSIRASLQTLFNQTRRNIPYRRQFMRRLYQDEIHQKQLLEILLRLLKSYENDRSNIVKRIRDNLSGLEAKTLRKGNVLPIIIKSLFDEPALKEMVLIYDPKETETLIDLIHTMVPDELKLGDDLGKMIKDGKGIEKLIPLVDDLVSTIIANIASRLPMNILGLATPPPPPPLPPPEEQEEDVTMYYQQQQQQQKQQQQQEQKQPLPVEACSWNISWLDIRVNQQLLQSNIKLLDQIAFNSDFILLQETPFDPHEYTFFDEQLRQSTFLDINNFHRAVVQPYLNIPGMKNQLHGMMIMVNRHKWDVVQRKRPQTHLLKPISSKDDPSMSIRTPEGAIVSSMPPMLFCTEPEIDAEQDLNRQAVWYSPDPMKDEHHEPHLFAKLSTLSGLFRSKSDPSFYMIVMNIHVRRIGYDERYRERLLRDINKQIQLYKEYLEKIKGSSFSILIGGDFNRSDHYIIAHILNYIPALRDGHVIMNPIPRVKPSIDAFIIPDHVPFKIGYIEPSWQQSQRQLIELTGGGIKSIFPQGGHTPFLILLNIPMKM